MQTTLWIALILFGILIFREPLRKRLESGARVKLGPFEIGELVNKVDNVEQQVDELQKKVSELFLLTMSEPMYINLRKLNSGKFGKYKMDDALKRELYHLRDIGYIEVAAIRSIPFEGDELSLHIVVTGTGRRFVELRESVTKSSS